jgi:RNA polymerase sigma factor (sigma-70 family)
MSMIYGKDGGVSGQIEVPCSTGSTTLLSDAQLLSRFAETRDSIGELAFSELVKRHGPMVLGVCRQILRHSHNADDAFQATFLVLVRKADSIRMGESLAPWLYSVAYRTAQRARAAALRDRPGIEEEIQAIEGSLGDSCMLDLRPLLYEELGRLPEKYRAPIVLCHLEGKTHEEAARLLGWPVGTVSGRLSRGRRLLRSRLERPWSGRTLDGLLCGLARRLSIRCDDRAGRVHAPSRDAVRGGANRLGLGPFLDPRSFKNHVFPQVRYGLARRCRDRCDFGRRWGVGPLGLRANQTSWPGERAAFRVDEKHGGDSHTQPESSSSVPSAAYGRLLGRGG